jgi:nucleoside transporter
MSAGEEVCEVTVAAAARGDAWLRRSQLCGMMFLQFFIWGAWFVTLGSFLSTNLDATGAQTALAYSTQSWGAILAPLCIGLIADRFVNAERLLAAAHLLGAVLLYLLYRSPPFAEFYPILFAYMLVYMPTLALVNSISFRHLDHPARQFSSIRVWGTIGWIVAGLGISFVFGWDAREALSGGALRNTFLLAAVASALLGVLSLILPATPPLSRGGPGGGLARAFGVDALRLLRDRDFLVFFVFSVLVCIPLAFYYQYANQFLAEIGVANATGKQTIGQVSEVLFMLAVPFFLHRFGVKKTLLVGMLAWSVRYLLFAYGDPDGRVVMLLIGIALHGACYDFFFVCGQIYTDSKAGERHRGSAQGLVTLATYGLGMLIGFHVAGVIGDMHAGQGSHDWRQIWLYPAVFAGLLFAAFALSFRNGSPGGAHSGPG